MCLPERNPDAARGGVRKGVEDRVGKNPAEGEKAEPDQDVPESSKHSQVEPRGARSRIQIFVPGCGILANASGAASEFLPVPIQQRKVPVSLRPAFRALALARGTFGLLAHGAR